MDHASLIAHIAREQADAREFLAQGRVPLDDEIAIRSYIADLLLRNSTALSQPQYVYDAIETLETILRRDLRGRADHPVVLNTLSFARMSEYHLTGSRRALDQAVLRGREAKDLIAVPPGEEQSEIYLEILNNLGFALGQRNTLVLSLEDLEEAISCSKEIHRIADPTSKPYLLNLNNFASRHRLKHKRTKDPSDYTKAVALISELMSLTKPGSDLRNVAVAQMSILTMDKYEMTGSMQDLEEAITNGVVALNALPEGEEHYVPMLAQLTGLYQVKLSKTGDNKDLELSLHYSGLLFDATPDAHVERGRRLLNYMQLILRRELHVKSLSTLELAIKRIHQVFSAMSSKYDSKEQCQRVFIDLLGLRYTLSGNFQDLASLANFTIETSDEFNSKSEAGGSSMVSVRTNWLYTLERCLWKLGKSPDDNRMRMLAEQELLQAFRSFYEVQNHGIDALIELHKEKGTRLEVFCQAIEVNDVLSDEEIITATLKLKESRALEDGERQRRPGYRLPEYETELGLRSLAIDPRSKDIVLDVSGLMKMVLGEDVSEPVSHEQFVAREARLEKAFINKAHSEGRHPNLKLCFMCRDVVKPLRRTTHGLELTAGHPIPLGNYAQLKLRRHCSVCRLIFSLITTTSGALHPWLAAIDPEVQGVRISSALLSSGEKLIRIDYGLKHVAELRIVTPRNHLQALRQGWEANSRSELPRTIVDENGVFFNRSLQQVNLDLIQSWLNNCDHNHGSACNTPICGKRSRHNTSLTFIDVNKECLISSTSDVKYFALSYVWGDANMSKTLTSNFSNRHHPGALSEAGLPKVIRDAMQFVRSLGERLLWVDAICLVQDNKEQMSANISQMDIIYGKAFATIVSLHGQNANDGLPGVTPRTRTPQMMETITISNKSSTLDHDLQSEANETFGLVATPPSLYMALELSTWNTRGWILQERFLSRRCIYFSPHAVYFQCNRETLSEAGANEEYVARLWDESETFLYDQPTLRDASHDNPLRKHSTNYELPQRQQIAATFGTYKELIEIYTKRNLSVKSDGLNAFTGMLAIVEDRFQGPTFQGLPSTAFSHALLWTPAARIPRRGGRLPDGLTNMSTFEYGEPDHKFPSWSWAGWDGAIEYRLFETAKGNTIIPTPLVELYKIGDPSSPEVTEIRQSVEEPNKIQVDNENPSFAEARSTHSRNLPEHGSNDTSNPENSQKQVLARLIPDEDRKSTWIVLPPLPVAQRKATPNANLLSFYAATAPLTKFKIMIRKHYLSSLSHVHIQGPQAVRRIHDAHDQHCGLWWEQAGYGYVGQGMSIEAESKIILVAISAYGDAYRRREGPSKVEGEIKLFDNEAFPEVGPGSGLVNVLVVDMDMGHPEGIGDRCTVAVIHRKAWEAAGPEVKEVRIA